MEIDRIALGDYIRDARESTRPRMSQLTLSRQIGRSRPWVTMLERGHPTVVLDTTVLQAIAETLGVPPTDLFRLAGVSLPTAEPGQLQWLSEQLDKPNLRRLVVIGHALLQEQESQPQRGAR